MVLVDDREPKMVGFVDEMVTSIDARFDSLTETEQIGALGAVMLGVDVVAIGNGASVERPSAHDLRALFDFRCRGEGIALDSANAISRLLKRPEVGLLPTEEQKYARDIVAAIDAV